MLPDHKFLSIEDVKKVQIKYAVKVNFVVIVKLVSFFLVVERVQTFTVTSVLLFCGTCFQEDFYAH